MPFTETKSGFDPVYVEATRAPQFILINEGAYDTFFKASSNYRNALEFFELRGYMLESKHVNAKKKWIGVPIIVATNTLPKIITEAARTSDDIKEKSHSIAFHTRIKFHQLTVSHKSTEKFPYTPEDLALYMHN